MWRFGFTVQVMGSYTEMKIDDYCDKGIQRDFHPVYDPITCTVYPERPIRRAARTRTAPLQAGTQKANSD